MKTVTLPPYLLRQFAIIVEGEMYSEGKHRPKGFDPLKIEGLGGKSQPGESEYEREFKKRLYKMCEEAYTHSFIPGGEDTRGNPRRVRENPGVMFRANPDTPSVPDDVFESAPGMFAAEGLFMKKYPNEHERAEMQRQFKGAIVHLAHIFLAMRKGMKPEDFVFLRKAEVLERFGRSKKSGASSTAYQDMLVKTINQYTRYTVCMAVLSSIEAVFTTLEPSIMDGVMRKLGVTTDAVKPETLKKINSKNMYEALNAPEMREQFAQIIYKAVAEGLKGVDFSAAMDKGTDGTQFTKNIQARVAPTQGGFDL